MVLQLNVSAFGTFELGPLAVRVRGDASVNEES